MASLRDVAAAAGCSVSTASVALSGRGPIAATTAKRVRAIAAEIGYQVDPLRAHLAASRFRQARSAVPIAFLRWKNIETLYQGFLCEMMPDAGYDCRVFDVDRRTDLHDLQKYIINAGCAGMIVHRRLALEHPKTTTYNWGHLAVIIAATVGPECAYTSHDIGIYEQWVLAWQRCVAAGYRRIGACCFDAKKPQHGDHLRYAACLAAQGECAAHLPKIKIFRDSKYQRGLVDAWRKRERPDVIITNRISLHNIYKRQPMVIAAGNRPKPRAQLAHTGPEDEQRCREVVALMDRLLREHQLGPLSNPQRITVSPSWYPGPSLPEQK